MTDDQQRARELRKQAAKILGDAYNAAHFFGAADDALSDTPSPHCQVTITAITAALRAAPVVPKARITEPLRADESRQEQADSAIYNRGWNDCRAALLNQRGVAVVTDGSQVVPSPALGAHEVHPEAVDVGLDLIEAGERLLAADALEHASGVRQNCDGSATAPDSVALRVAMTTLEQIANAPDDQGAKFNAAATVAFLKTQGAGGPEGFVVVPVEPTEEMLIAAKRFQCDHSENEDWMEWEGLAAANQYRAMLAARPQGVK